MQRGLSDKLYSVGNYIICIIIQILYFESMDLQKIASFCFFINELHIFVSCKFKI